MPPGRAEAPAEDDGSGNEKHPPSSRAAEAQGSSTRRRCLGRHPQDAGSITRGRWEAPRDGPG
eukprot:12904606-Prorocentrum_lima.AAC.1